MSIEGAQDETAFDRAVSSDPYVMSGALVFAGTRVPVDALFDNLIDDMTIDEFLKNFPTVERWQVAAVIRFGARSFGAGRTSSAELNNER